MAEPKNIKRKVRTLQVVATLSIAMMLFLLGSSGYLIAIGMKAGGAMQERATIHIFMLTTADSSQVASVGSVLKTNFREIREVTFKSKEEVLEEYRQINAEEVDNFMEFLGENPLPDLYEVSLHKEYSLPKNLSELERDIMALDGVDRVVYQKTMMENLAANIDKFNLVLLLFGGALLLVTLILLGNTIRLTIYSRRHIISTMKLVGSSRWFIMKPFIRESIFEGLVAWIFSGAMFILLVMGINERILITKDNIWLWVLGIMFVIGIVVSVLFTMASVNKFVKMNTAKIEIY